MDRFHTTPAGQLEFPLSPAVVNHHRILPREEMQDMMMLGLRLTREGVSAWEFSDRFQIRMVDVFGKEIKELVQLGLLEWAGSGSLEVLRLTRRGRLLGNQVFMRFVGD